MQTQTRAPAPPRVGVNRCLASACVLAAATTVIHVVAGGASVWRPVAESGLAQEARLTSLAVWHMASVALGLSALALGRGALPRFARRSHDLVVFMSVLWVGFALCFVGTALTESAGHAFAALPQPLLLLPVGVLALIGSRRAIP